jgi:hypothetical protein
MTASSMPRSKPQTTGWMEFAAVVLFVAGFFAAMFGLGGILNDDVVTVGGQGVLIWDFTAWGWAQLIIGGAMMLTSVGLFGAKGWARWMAIGFATLNAIGQVGVFPAFPLWALTIIALDVVVIYQLTAHHGAPATVPGADDYAVVERRTAVEDVHRPSGIVG